MSIFRKYFNPIAIITALVMNTFISGCSSSGSANPVSSTSSSTLISNYSLAGSTGIIDEATKTIAVTVPNGTDITKLVATYTTEGASVKVGTISQTSGTTPNNFTAPVSYIVTAGNGTTATYTVTVTVASATDKSMTTYFLAGVAGVINEPAKTIAVAVPYGTNVTALVATFTSTGSVKVGTTTQTSGVTPNNFTNPVAYIVTAGDASTATYTVTVTVASNTAKAITAYSFSGYTGASGVINETAKTIAVTVPNGTNVTALVATFTSTGTTVKVGTKTQTSTATANNFTAPVAYIVTAGDGSTATYTVTVAVAANSAKAITAYTFAGQPDSVGVISESLKTITVSVLPGTDKTARTATFTTTGTNVKVGNVVQTSGATLNDFTNTVIYTVTAADSTTTPYNVTVTEGAGPIPIDLGTAGNFAILTKAGVSTTVGSAIVGDIGVSPVATSYITGFGTLTAGATYATSPLVTGKIYAADMIPPTPTYMTTAIGDMEIAYNAAAGRAAGVGVTNLNRGAGTLAGETLTPGTYTWGGDVTITTDLTLNGGVNDVWIFQIGNKLDLNSNHIILTGGAQAKNIFWQVAGAVTLGTNSHFEGIILAKTNIAVLTGASANARLLAQTAVTLQSNAITQP
ncbi:MAG: ice-binding family protein [Sulfuricurvum sp.]|nr:ice-binding family protein [Sulfuricurvum sp.]